MIPSLSPKVRNLWYTNAKRCTRTPKVFLQMRRSTTLASCSSHWFSSMPLGIHLWYLQSATASLPFFQLSFSQSLLILEAVTILSMVWASLTPHDYFSKQTLHHILLWIAGGLTMLGLTNILVHWDFLSLLLITFLGYLVAKINPKVSSLLMSKLPAEKLASTSSFLGLMVSFAMPLGTALFLV